MNIFTEDSLVQQATTEYLKHHPGRWLWRYFFQLDGGKTFIWTGQNFHLARGKIFIWPFDGIQAGKTDRVVFPVPLLREKS